MRVREGLVRKGVCILHMKLFVLPIDIQQIQCPCQSFILEKQLFALERCKTYDNNLRDRDTRYECREGTWPCD